MWLPTKSIRHLFHTDNECYLYEVNNSGGPEPYNTVDSFYQLLLSYPILVVHSNPIESNLVRLWFIYYTGYRLCHCIQFMASSLSTVKLQYNIYYNPTPFLLKHIHEQEHTPSHPVVMVHQNSSFCTLSSVPKEKLTTPFFLVQD